jgi:hypothetical protein
MLFFARTPPTSDTSRDRNSAVLNATIRTGFLYSPTSRFVDHSFAVGLLLVRFHVCPAESPEVRRAPGTR